MKQAQVIGAAALLAAFTALGVPYDPAVHGDPIIFDSAEPVLIEGNGAVVDGQGEARCATLGANVTLTNFVFRNGFADFGGGVRGGVLLDCTIENCTADLAGGAYGTVLSNCVVTGCAATESGAALGDCSAFRCEITGNRRTVSSSLAAVRGGVVYGSTLTRCTLAGNNVGLGANAPAFGGIGADTTLEKCTVADDNVVTAADGVCYGRAFAYSTVNGQEVTFSDEADPGDPEPEAPFDGSVARHYTTTLEDGSMLSISTAKESLKKGVSTVAVTAILTKDGVEYSYSGGEIKEGFFVTVPTSRTYGAPAFRELDFRADAVEGILGGEWLEAKAITAETFAGSFELTPLRARVGVAQAGRVVVDASWGPVKYAASKLPSGLKLNARTGAVTGVPTKAGTFQTTVTVTSTLNAKLKSAMSFPYAVDAIDDWAVGTFNGGADETFEAEGQAAFTVSKAGKVSGKWLSGGQAWKVTAGSYARYEGDGPRYVADLVFTLGSGRSAQVVTNELAVTEDAVCGALATSACFVAYLDSWKREPWKTLGKRLAKAAAYAYAPAGCGAGDTVSLKVAASGKVSVKGRIAGKSVSGSAVLCPQTAPDPDGAFDAVVFVYLPKAPLANGYGECVRLRWNGTSFTAPEQ